MKFQLGTILPTEDAPYATIVNSDPIAAPAAPAAPQAPAGYWVNPANPTQWLPPDQAAKLGGICFFGTGITPGRVRVGGNGPNTKVYCGSFFESRVTDSIVFYGGAAALAWFLLPSPYRYWVALPIAGLGVLGALGAVEI